MHDTTLFKIINHLKKISRKIKELESKASYSLYENYDQPDYESKLRTKTELLVNLPSSIEELLPHLSVSLRSLVTDKVGGIAFSAEKAIMLESIFYMSALLYPEDYKPGDLNDLEIFINTLEDIQDE